jgi:hypothetical protein
VSRTLLNRYELGLLADAVRKLLDHRPRSRRDVDLGMADDDT